MKSINFDNVGFLEQKLSKEVLQQLNSYIKNKKENWNKQLIGHISSSNILEDKDDWFFTNTILPTIKKFQHDFTPSTHYVPHVLTKSCEFVLDRIWVNFQKKHEFNPLHDHSGVYSFVIWLTIPSDYNKEKELPFVKHAIDSIANVFEFAYVNSLGKLCTHKYKLSADDEGTMLFFPAKLFHSVYPFYLSNKTRISVSGNISLNPEKIMKK